MQAFSIVPASWAADARTIEAAERMLEKTGAGKVIDVLWPNISSVMRAQFNAQFPRKEKEVDDIINYLRQEFKLASKELVRNLAERFADNFTYEEILSVISFYETPAGAKFVEKQPILMAESSNIGLAISQKIILKLTKEKPELINSLAR
jgi:hypothetical protein